MRAVVTRVRNAFVTVAEKKIAAISQGYLVLLGISTADTPVQVQKLADKVCHLRVFEDENGKMNRSLAQVDGSILVVSQFTLYADCKSRRPGFTAAARGAQALPLYHAFLSACAAQFPVAHGEFGADMQVFSQNDGPVTLLLDTDTL
ncbi:MAG: D-tyrosyl-tRNA(Tyr) deacylase [Oscillospiraceae bacterium]|nr:D-tyrosyl-tRNA(Tyr) deacylase [Oscillospiraceae bacterium]